MQRMKPLACALILAMLAASPALAQEGKKKRVKIDVDIDTTGFALGLFLGEPTGITFQVDMAESQALEFKTAWNFTPSDRDSEDSGSFTIQGNYVWWFPGVLFIKDLDLPPFVGIGAEMRIGSDTPQIGVRIPFGIRHRFETAPVEVALELGAGMSLIPSTRFLWSGGLALRYRF